MARFQGIGGIGLECGNFKSTDVVGHLFGAENTIRTQMIVEAALARALAVEGEVWLLDEPFAGVDLDRAERILERLRALKRPTLLTGHSPQLAALCDRAVEL